MVIVTLIILGLILGSFVNALVWRLHEQSLPLKKRRAEADSLSVGRGRSMCPKCAHTLHAIDLIPVVSWLALKGKCRYCRKTVSWQYPVVEVLTAFIFVFSYIFWPSTLDLWGTIGFISWLVCLVGLIALVVYDLRWMLLPNRIIFPLYGVAAIFIVSHMVSEGSVMSLMSVLASILIGGGIFYALFQVSSGKLIGGGDVKLGFLLGALLLTPLHATLMLFIASLLGSLVALPLMASGKAGYQTRIPFGPFLIAAAIIVQLFGGQMIDWYTNQILEIS